MKDGWNEGRKEGKKGGGKLTKYIKIINWIAKKKKKKSPEDSSFVESLKSTKVHRNVTQLVSPPRKEPHHYAPSSAPHLNISSAVAKEPVRITVEIVGKLCVGRGKK